MANAKKCDRCGKYFDRSNFWLVIKDDNLFHCDEDKDLCQECCEEFNKWFNKFKNEEEK